MATISFTIDRVVPSYDDGANSFENYALACFHCNRHKSNKQFVEQGGAIIELFNPRKMFWSEHFIWSADKTQIIPLTDIGAVTIKLPKLNRERIIAIRQADILVERHPPVNDPIK